MIDTIAVWLTLTFSLASRHVLLGDVSSCMNVMQVDGHFFPWFRVWNSCLRLFLEGLFWSETTGRD